MARPSKIVRADKIQGVVSSLPENKKYTFTEANEDRDKTNAIIDYLHFDLSSDSSGIIQSSQLVGKDITKFIGAGAVWEEGTEGDGIGHFSKATNANTITMINGNSLPEQVRKYTLFTR